jgi:hypothetical protein
LQLCLSIKKSLGSVLEQFVINCDYSEIPWKCKGTELLLDCRRNQYKIVVCEVYIGFSISISLSLIFLLIRCTQTPHQNLCISYSDQTVSTKEKESQKKRTQFNPPIIVCFSHLQPFLHITVDNRKVDLCHI